MTQEREFQTLLEEHWGIVRKVAGIYAPTWDEQEDVAQEICLQLWRSFGSYDPSRPFSTWMYRVALNTGISFARRARRRPLAEAIDTHALPARDPAERVSKDRADALYEFIHGLDELSRALVLLHLEDKSHREIADILGISETNVSTRLSRFRARARESLVEAEPKKGRTERGAH